MPQFRHLTAAVAIAAVMLLVMASVAAAHPGHRFGPRSFDNIWIDRAGDDFFEDLVGARDLLIGLDGDDVIWAGARRDYVRGNSGDDTLHGGDRSDNVSGGPGDDTIYGDAGRDLLRGKAGADTIYGGSQRDRIIGGPGNDFIDGGAGRDVIRAGAGDDVIYAVDGRPDWIRCGTGDDAVTADKDLDRVAANCGDPTWEVHTP